MMIAWRECIRTTPLFLSIKMTSNKTSFLEVTPSSTGETTITTETTCETTTSK
jgi:hypothetical protein